MSKESEEEPLGRPPSPGPSCVSMKSDASINHPVNFRGEEGTTAHRRPSSPGPSCVSMKTDHSINHPVNFRGEEGTTAHRPPSPVPSCVSMKSDASIDQPVNFRGEGTTAHRAQTPRAPSPVPSCVSMKSDRSMDKPPRFSNDPVLPHPQRPSSPGPSCVSMKTDHSINHPVNFRGEEGTTAHRISLKRSLVPYVGLLNPSTDVPPVSKRKRPSEPHGEVKQIHKLHLQQKFQCLLEGSVKQGNPTPLCKVYTDLYITEGARGRVNDEHEIRQIERASWREVDPGRPIAWSDLFKTGSGRDKPIRSVLTRGVAGIGKTVSVQKFILDWAEAETNQDIDFVFPLPFRELNLITEMKLSLVDLVQEFFPDVKSQQILTNSAHRVLFIFDGLDECRLPLDFHSSPICCDVTEPASVDVLLTNLIKGSLLPSALLWITTRPAAANQIPPEYVHQSTEIRGFNDPKKEEYFKKRISDLNQASRIITHLKSSRSLYIMCEIPVFCCIAATVAEVKSEESGKVEMPRTMTEMYAHFLVIQTNIKKAKYTGREVTEEEMIFKLGQLAFQQLEKGNLIFYEEDLREAGLDVSEASVYSGVCTQIFREETKMFQGRVFSFVHLSIQEFLAALYVFLCFCNREGNMSDEEQSAQLSALFRVATLQDLHKTAVDLALQNKNGHLDLFLRFLLGLSLESNQKILKVLLPKSSSQAQISPLPHASQSQSSEQTVQYVKEKIRDPSWFERRITLFYCLNELNRHAVVEHTHRSLGTLSVDVLVPGKWETKKFEFKMSEVQLDGFDLEQYVKTPAEDQTELLSPGDVLQRLVPVATMSTSVRLIHFNLSEECCSSLASALKSPSSRLTQLNLSENKIFDSALQIICDGARHDNSKLEQFLLKGCNLREKDCSHLASILTSQSSSITKLDLSQNELLDAGMKHLRSGLKHKNSKLEILELSYCELTEKSCQHLASVLTSQSSRLRVLNLGNNNLLDSGVKHLCRGLRHQNCRLERMQINKCNLTEKSCSFLASALTSPVSHLTHLDLSYNELKDSGVEMLCSAVCDENCKLEQLELRSCKLTEGSCKLMEDKCFTLASVLTSDFSRLTHLNLSSNKLMNSGVELLCSALKHENCLLEKLLLNSCHFTGRSCSYLASVLTSHSSRLTHLDLSYNELLDSGVEHLCSGLRDENCKLEKLELWKCKMAEESCSHLASVLSTPSSRLRQLELTNNRLQDSGVELLCRGLSHQNCKLEKLQLDSCKLTEKSCSFLASALTSHSSSHLTQLDLSNNCLHEAHVQPLCTLLKEPTCTLTELEWRGK
ncbi:NACHT, LRR and PYD domains-containing protein 3-like [Engraulis encrasicolus]|uniref:NACHT, LRR and PYD domains-containing protein 3-like n=1 Tax=Engraulis encrasicolus TaxID=184585 RepID=UPI002FD630BC